MRTIVDTRFPFFSRSGHYPRYIMEKACRKICAGKAERSKNFLYLYNPRVYSVTGRLAARLAQASPSARETSARRTRALTRLPLPLGTFFASFYESSTCSSARSPRLRNALAGRKILGHGNKSVCGRVWFSCTFYWQLLALCAICTYFLSRSFVMSYFSTLFFASHLLTFFLVFLHIFTISSSYFL